MYENIKEPYLDDAGEKVFREHEVLRKDDNNYYKLIYDNCRKIGYCIELAQTQKRLEVYNSAIANTSALLADLSLEVWKEHFSKTGKHRPETAKTEIRGYKKAVSYMRPLVEPAKKLYAALKNLVGDSNPQKPRTVNLN